MHSTLLIRGRRKWEEPLTSIMEEDILPRQEDRPRSLSRLWISRLRKERKEGRKREGEGQCILPSFPLRSFSFLLYPGSLSLFPRRFPLSHPSSDYKRRHRNSPRSDRNEERRLRRDVDVEIRKILIIAGLHFQILNILALATILAKYDLAPYPIIDACQHRRELPEEDNPLCRSRRRVM